VCASSAPLRSQEARTKPASSGAWTSTPLLEGRASTVHGTSFQGAAAHPRESSELLHPPLATALGLAPPRAAARAAEHPWI